MHLILTDRNVEKKGFLPASVPRKRLDLWLLCFTCWSISYTGWSPWFFSDLKPFALFLLNLSNKGEIDLKKLKPGPNLILTLICDSICAPESCADLIFFHVTLVWRCRSQFMQLLCHFKRRFTTTLHCKESITCCNVVKMHHEWPQQEN